MTRPTYVYWNPTGMFRIPVAGTSHYRDEIEAIAQNPDGSRALVSCYARIVLDNNNPHDENAVAVVIQNTKVGHLARDYAKTYRSYISELPPRFTHISAQAVITGGLVASDGTAYEYTIELDIPEDLKASLMSEEDDEVIRANGYPPLVQQPDGTYSVKVWVPTPNFSEFHKSREVQTWTTDHWDSVNFYITNRQNIGLGFKVYEMPKSEYARLFQDSDVYASIELETSRIATLRVRPD